MHSYALHAWPGVKAYAAAVLVMNFERYSRTCRRQGTLVRIPGNARGESWPRYRFKVRLTGCCSTSALFGPCILYSKNRPRTSFTSHLGIDPDRSFDSNDEIITAQCSIFLFMVTCASAVFVWATIPFQIKHKYKVAKPLRRGIP